MTISGTLSLFTLSMLGFKIECTYSTGTCTESLTGIFADDNWATNGLTEIKTKVQAFLKGLFPDSGTLSMEKLIEKLVNPIPIGGGEIKLAIGLTYSRTFTPKCGSEAETKQELALFNDANKKVLEPINKVLGEAGDAVKGKSLDFPLTPFIGMSLGIIFGFSLSTEIPANDPLTITAKFESEVGMKGTFTIINPTLMFRLGLKLLDNISLLKDIYDLIQAFDTIKTILEAIKNLQIPAGGTCPPGPPNGHPDDRRDAIGEGAPPAPSGASGRLLYLQQQLATAERAGFTRAAIYWRYQLRTAELDDFTSDTTKALSNTAEITELLTTTHETIQSIISGTITLTATQTITDALLQVNEQAFYAMTHTAYDQERETLLSALNFAERQYARLRGQELELQRELRLMAQASGVGVVDSGLVDWTLAALTSVGISAAPIQIVPGVGGTHVTLSRYLDPSEAPATLVVPSGGLNRYDQSSAARGWLEQYVLGGGTLIVLAQADSVDWELLPGGVTGLGYNQDILCKTASVEVVNSTPWLDGIDRNRPDIQVDGSFTSWPVSSTLLLMRTTGNRLPAMLEYPYGAGTVVATSAYPDFYINGMQSEDDIIFARSLFGAAFLRGTGQAAQVTVQPGAQATLITTVTNTLAQPVTELTVWRDYYRDGIGDSWRWNAHQPAQLRAAQIVPLDPPLASGERRTVTFQVTAPAQGGLFRTGLFVGNTERWGGSGALAGPFYRVAPTSQPNTALRVQLATDQPAYAYRATATLSATLQNLSDATQTVTLVPTAGLRAAPITLTVAAHSTAVHSYTLLVDGERPVRLNVINGATAQPLVVTVRLREPLLGLVSSPVRLVADTTMMPLITATLADVALGSTIAWVILHDGAPVLTTTTALVAHGDYATAELTPTLPGQPADTAYTVQAQVVGTALVITQTLPVEPLVTLQNVVLTTQPTVAATTPAGVRATFATAGQPAVAQLQMLITRGSMLVSSSPVITAPMRNLVERVLVPLTVPALTPALAYTLVLSGTVTHADGTTLPIQRVLPDQLSIPNPTLQVLNAQVQPGTSLDLVIVPPLAAPRLALHTVTATLDLGTPLVRSITPTLESGRLRLQVPVPASVRPGTYGVTVATADLPGWSARDSWLVSGYQLQLTALTPPAQPGQPLSVQVANRGAIAAQISGTLALRDDRGLVVMSQPLSRTLATGAQLTTTLALPSQLRRGFYTLLISGRDQFGPISPLSSERFAVAGLEVSLQAQTPRLSYTPSEGVTPTVTISATQPITSAWLTDPRARSR